MQTEVQIRILSPTDGALLENVAGGVFDGPLDSRLSAEFIADPRHHLAVATVREQVVGMASAVHYVHPDKGPELWVNEIGVAPSFQRQGLAKQLLNCFFQHGSSLGCTEAWVLTEERNVAARNLYADVGGTQPDDTTIYFTFRLSNQS